LSAGKSSLWLVRQTKLSKANSPRGKVAPVFFFKNITCAENRTDLSLGMRKIYGPAKSILVHNSITGLWEQKEVVAKTGDVQLQLVGNALVLVTINQASPASANWENTPEAFLCRD
jgi:hypothetical protein